jgi:hypothetical protein
MAYGTLSTLDTLATVRQTVIEFGEDRAWDSIAAALAAHNAQKADMRGDLVERSTDVRRAYGTTDAKRMDEMDQWGLPDAQASRSTSPCGAMATASSGPFRYSGSGLRRSLRLRLRPLWTLTG